MSDHFTRTERPVEGKVFFAMPYGPKTLSKGGEFDFNEFYREELAPTIEECGMTAERADSIYGPQTVMEPIWQGLQQAEVVIVDFTTKAPNVALEYGMALLINKKMIYLTQDDDDIPTDVRGRLRYITYSRDYRAVKKLREELKRHLDAIRKMDSIEMTLEPMAAGGTTPAPGRVNSVHTTFVVVETDSGKLGVLSNADVEWNRIIPDMNTRFKEGDRLNGAFSVDTDGIGRYTLLAGKPDPWPQLQATYAPGTTFTGVVQSVRDGVGAFVRVDYGVNGLIPKSLTPGAMQLSRGNEVEVTVTQVDPGQRRIQLKLVRVVDQTLAPISAVRPTTNLTVGTRHEAEVVKAVPENGGKGGFILVKFPGRTKPALLPCTKMSDLLRNDLNAADVEAGELLTVEVVQVDASRDRVIVKEVPDVEDVGKQAAAA